MNVENFETVKKKSLRVTIRSASKSTKYLLENCNVEDIAKMSFFFFFCNDDDNNQSLLWYFIVNTKLFTWWRMLIDLQIICMCAIWYEA